MMFNPKKANPKLKKPAPAPSSPTRDALLHSIKGIESANATAKAAEANIARLREIVTAVAPAQASVQRAVASDGGKSLASFASEGGKGGIGKLIETADSAARAAAVANAALPAAERALVDANAAIGRLEDEKGERVKDVLVEHVDVIAQSYRECFEQLGEIHDSLVAAVEGARLSGARLIDVAMEIPRFNLPALSYKPPEFKNTEFSHHGLPRDVVYSPYLKHQSDTDQIGAQRLIWSRFAAALHENPDTKLGDLSLEIDPKIVAAQTAPGLIRHDRTRANEPSINEVLYGGAR
jgi:hypothetical protein